MTLLLVNAFAAETLPLALDQLGLPKPITIAISVFGVLVFGEILPSAIFTGPKQLEIASFFGPFVEVLETVLGILVIPIARLLDAVLGKEHKGRYNKGELKALINLQLRENQQHPTGLGAGRDPNDDRGDGVVEKNRRRRHGAFKRSVHAVAIHRAKHEYYGHDRRKGPQSASNLQHPPARHSRVPHGQEPHRRQSGGTNKRND